MKRKLYSSVFLLFVLPNLSLSQSRGVNFDGIDDRIDIADDPSLWVESAFTVECWFKADDVSTEKVLFDKNGGGGNWRISLKPKPTEGTKICLSSTSWAPIELWGTTDLVTNTWYHFAATWNGSVRTVYLNGAMEATDVPAGDPAGGGSPAAVGSVSLGSLEFAGDIDELRVWNVSQPAPTILGNYTSEISSAAANLVLAYNLADGVAFANNTAVFNPADASGTGNTGSLVNFAKFGCSSNYVCGAPVLGGICDDNGLMLDNMVIDSVICFGDTAAISFDITGGTSPFTWDFDTYASGILNVDTTWATTVIDFSTEWNPVNWGAIQALGPPDTYPAYGDIITAWASATAEGALEFLVLGYPATDADKVVSYETLGPGAVDTVYVRQVSTGTWITIYSGTATIDPPVAVIKEYSIPPGTGLVDAVRLAINSPAVPDWNEIDAVGLVSSGNVYVSGFTAGSYTVHVEDNTGCILDSIVDIIEPAEISLSQTFTICTGDSVVVGTSVYSVQGSYSDVYVAANGCDSTVYTDLTVIPAIDNTTSVTGITISSNESSGGVTYQWIDCSTMLGIPGETGQDYTPSANGNYAVIVTNGPCSDTSACVTIADIGFGNSGNDDFSIYPNPFNDEFHIKVSGKSIVTVVNLMCEIVVEATSISSEAVFDLGHASDGIYLVRIATDELTSTVKLVKH